MWLTRLIERLAPALGEVEAALDIVNLFRDRPAGTLKLNVPVSAAWLVLPAILPGFLAAYPDIQVEIVAGDGFVDMVASGCDAGIRYDERLEQDMIAPVEEALTMLTAYPSQLMQVVLPMARRAIISSAPASSTPVRQPPTAASPTCCPGSSAAVRQNGQTRCRSSRPDPRPVSTRCASRWSAMPRC